MSDPAKRSSQPPGPEHTAAKEPERRVAIRRASLASAVLALIGLVAWLFSLITPSQQLRTRASTDAGSASAPDALHGPRTLTGMVQDDLGEPLSEALVRVSSLNAPSLPAREARSDVHGAFELTDLPSEALAIEVTCSGHEGKEHMLLAQDRERLTFVLARQGELAVALRDVPGSTMEGAEVVITGPGIWPAQAGAADARGELVFKGLPAGEYRVRARRGARVALPSEPVAVVPGKRTDAELSLVEGASLHGSVLDQQSRKPIARAHVSVQDLTPGIDALELVSDERGEFHALGLWPGAVRVEAQQEGYASNAQDLTLPSATPIVLTLAGAASLAGSVVDEAGKPVAGARISVSTDEGLPVELASESARRADGVGELGVTSGPVPALPLFQNTEFALGTLAAESDARGQFTVARLAPSALALHVARPGYVAERVAIGELSPHEERSGLRVVLREAGRVVGRVLDARGRALAGVYVAARSGEREQSALTDGAGEYTLRDLLGPVLVEAQPDGHSTVQCRTEVRARGDARCDLTADSAVHALTVRVVDSYGFGLEGAIVSVTASGARDGGLLRGALSSTQLTRRDGSASLRELPSPPYLLDVKLGGHLSIEDLPVRDAEHEVRIELALAATLAGFVVDSLGRPVPFAFVSTEEGEASADADAQGAFLLDGVPAGTHSLLGHHASAGDGRSAEVRARPNERLDGVRIMLNGRFSASDAGTAPSTTRNAPADFALELRGRVLVVTQVAANSAAARAGLRIGDVVAAVDGETPLSPAHARGLLRDPPGRAAVLRVLRQKRPVNLRYKRPPL